MTKFEKEIARDFWHSNFESGFIAHKYGVSEAEVLNIAERTQNVRICQNCGGSFRVKVKGQMRCSECQKTRKLTNEIRRITGL